jgi:hypothetical protein
VANQTHFRVTGIDRSGNEVVLIGQATSSEEARATVEADGVRVMTVETIDPRRLKAGRRPGRIAAAFAWLLIIFSMVGALGMLPKPREPEIEAFFGGDRSPENFGYVLGALFGSSLFTIIAGVLIVCVQRAGGRTLKLQVAALVAFCMVAFAVFKPTLGPQATNAQASRAFSDMATLMDSVGGRPGEVRTAPPDIQADPGKHGDMAFVVNLMNELAQSVSKEATEYQTATINLGLDTVLLPSTLTRPDRLAEAEAKVQTALRLFAKYESGYEGCVERARKRVADAPVAPEVRAGMSRGLEEGLRTNLPLMRRMFNYERTLLEETAAVVEFASERQGQIATRGGQLLFENDQDAAAYNDSVLRIQTVAERQGELQLEITDRARAQAARMRAAAADPDSFDPPAAPRARSATMRIVLGAEGPAINDWRIPFGSGVDVFTRELGKPERTLDHEHGVMLLWDSLGLFASADSAAGPVTEFGILQFPQDNLPEFPTKPFAGTVTMAGATIGEVDTPRVLNRRLVGAKFEQYADTPLWTATFSGHRVAMMIDPNGLCDYIWVLPPEEPQPAARPTRGPRF